MKKSACPKNLRRIVKVSIFIMSLLLSGLNAFAMEQGTAPHGLNGARYITVGYRKMPENVVGTGMTYGLGFKSNHFAMELYSCWMETIPKGMEKIPKEFWGGGVPTGEMNINSPSAGFDFNLFVPVNKRVELYFGPSLNFEKLAQVYTSDGSAAIMGGATRGQRYSDWSAHTKTRINGQAGVAFNIETGAKFNVYLMAGYSLYRGITGSIGVSF